MSKYVVESTKSVGMIYTWGPRSWNVFFVKVTGTCATTPCKWFATKQEALDFVAARGGEVVTRKQVESARARY